MRVLVIEDDLRMLELLRKGLSESGFEVTTASDGDTGLALAFAHRFDVLVLDVGLPGRSGYSITAHLRQHSKPPAIVMLTALNQEDQIVCGLDAGADDYITKPWLPAFTQRRVALGLLRRITFHSDHSASMLPTVACFAIILKSTLRAASISCCVLSLSIAVMSFRAAN